MKTDLLVFAAHPDDAELACAGTLLKHIHLGYKAGIIDLTKGELGTRGNADIRRQEAQESSKILGISFRVNLGFADGFFSNDQAHRMEIIKSIRKHRPEIILCNAIRDRHPDHGRAANLVSDSCFLSGLSKIETVSEGKKQEAWRPRAIYHSIQDRFIQPDIIVDISDFIEKKNEAIRAFRSQFHDPASKEPQTYISTPEFFESLTARAIEFGKVIGVKYGEGFTVERWIGTNDLMKLL